MGPFAVLTHCTPRPAALDHGFHKRDLHAGKCHNSSRAPLPQNNFFTSNSTAQISLTLTGKQQYFRLLSSDISSNAPNAWSNLISSYGVLKTLAGNGQLGVDVSNFWQSSFEGGRATNANLSRPHFAMADTNGNIFIVNQQPFGFKSDRGWKHSHRRRDTRRRIQRRWPCSRNGAATRFSKRPMGAGRWDSLYSGYRQWPHPKAGFQRNHDDPRYGHQWHCRGAGPLGEGRRISDLLCGWE